MPPVNVPEGITSAPVSPLPLLTHVIWLNGMVFPPALTKPPTGVETVKVALPAAPGMRKNPPIYTCCVAGVQNAKPSQKLAACVLLVVINCDAPVPTTLAATVTETVLTGALFAGVPPPCKVPVNEPLPTARYTIRVPAVMLTVYADTDSCINPIAANIAAGIVLAIAETFRFIASTPSGQLPIRQ